MREREHRKVRKPVQDFSASHSEVKSVCDSKAPSSIPYFLSPYSLTDPELSGGVIEVLSMTVNYLGENLPLLGIRSFWISSRRR